MSELKQAKKSVPNDASPKDSGSENGSSSDEPSQNSDSSESSALQKSDLHESCNPPESRNVGNVLRFFFAAAEQRDLVPRANAVSDERHETGTLLLVFPDIDTYRAHLCEAHGMTARIHT